MSVVDALTITGSRQQCIGRLREAVSWGITQPQLLLDRVRSRTGAGHPRRAAAGDPVISLENRVAIVTGAGAGLGRSYAHALAQRGARVLVNDLGAALDGTGADVSAADVVAAEIVAAGARRSPITRRSPPPRAARRS